MLANHWNNTLTSIRESVPTAQYHMWFRQLEFVRCDEKSIFLRVPSSFHEEWLKSNYTQQIRAAVRKNFGSELQLEFEVLVHDENIEASFSVTPPPVPSQRPALRVVEGGNQPEAEDSPETKEADKPGLPVFTGEYFELDFNRLACQYAELLCDGFHTNVNPLLVVAGVGMGKTHLLSYIGNRFVVQFPELRIRYTHAEKFTQEMVQSWKNPTGPDYRKRYRDETDILLFDDLHGINGRKHTQEQLLHIFNEILSRGGKVVFTSSVPVQQFTDLIDPLRSRLVSGVTAEIKNVTYQDRVALLSLVAQQNQISVEEPVLRTLADSNGQDIRETLGTFLRMHIQSKLQNQAFTCDYLAKEGMLRDAPKEPITLDEIIGLVEYGFGISRTDLVSRSRKGNVAWARQVVLYLSRRFTLLSLEDIGKSFGRDHATVLYAYDKVMETMDAHPAKRYEVEFLIQKLQARLARPGDDCPL